MKKLAICALLALLVIPVALAAGNDVGTQESVTAATSALATATTHEAAGEPVDLRILVKMAIH